jgi:hypothetical protein
MRDEEFIEMEQKRMPYSKPLYKLKATDFIPIVGWINYDKRTLKNLESIEDEQKRTYRNECLKRHDVLNAYNTGIGVIIGSGIGIEVAVLLSK